MGKFRLYQISGKFQNPLIMEYGKGYLEYQARVGEELIIAERLGLKHLKDLGEVTGFFIDKRSIGEPCPVIDIKTRQRIN